MNTNLKIILWPKWVKSLVGEKPHDQNCQIPHGQKLQPTNSKS